MKIAKRFVVFLLVFLLALLVSPAYAGTITVDTLTDGVGVAGVCTLREAIAQANVGVDGDGCTGVTASPNTINLSVTGDYELTTGSQLPDITSTITIQESGGATANIQAGSAANTANYRVFNVPAGSLTLSGVTVRYGGTTSFVANGGCIAVSNGASLTLTNGTVVSDCRTSTLAGGIYNGSGSTTTITNSTVRDNISGTAGGGVASLGTLTLSGATISGNRSGNALQGAGGGVAYNGSALSISGSTFSGNQGISASDTDAYGGGLYAGIASGTSTVSGSTFTNNQVSGGTSNNYGGAIVKTGTGTLMVSGSVFTGNSVSGAGSRGGVFYNDDGTLTVTSSRIENNNSSGTTTGDVLYTYPDSVTISSLTGSCIVNNGDTAVVDDQASALTSATGNWWGTDWGPNIAGAGGGSAVSTGDSISGSGTANVNVGLTSAGTVSTAPTGNWLTTAPVIAGGKCLICTPVSAASHSGRVCS